MNYHFVKIDLSDMDVTSTPHIVCRAPEQSPCHLVFACDCESWQGIGYENGSPYHTVCDLDKDREVRHFGRYEVDSCLWVDWAQNSDECLSGEVWLPVNGIFVDDYMEFTAKQPTITDVENIVAEGLLHVQQEEE